VEVGLFIAFGMMAIVVTTGYFSPRNRAKRRARRTERALATRQRSWISEAHGPVRVIGRIHRDAKLLEAPLSGRRCVVYELVVDELSSGSPSLWRRLLDLRQACPFLLEDDSGTARIDTAGPGFVALVHDRVGVTSGVYPGNHLELSMVLESWGLLPTTWLGRWRPLRYAEGVLEAAGDRRLARDVIRSVHEEATMLWTIALVLLLLWGLGLVSSVTMGGFIHVLLVAAVVIVLVRVIQGRSVA
jgi:hypothetical protein